MIIAQEASDIKRYPIIEAQLSKNYKRLESATNTFEWNRQ